MKITWLFFEAGSPYPDWGYLCKNDAGETSHWQPFLYQLADYIKVHHEPWSKEYNQTVAFLFGVMSHAFADMFWHWGPDDQGYIYSLSHDSSDAKDDFSTAHDLSDNGAEFYLSGREGLHTKYPYWKVPSKALEEVYKNIGIKAPWYEIDGCVFLMYLGNIFDKIISYEYFQIKFNKHEAFLVEELDQWFTGGVQDMATNSMWKWLYMIDYLEGKVKVDYKDMEKTVNEYKLTHNYTKIENKLSWAFELVRKNETLLHDLINFLGITTTQINNYTQFEMTAQFFSADLIKKIFSYLKPFLEFNSEYLNVSSKPILKNDNPSTIFESNFPYNYFGNGFAIGDFDADGIDEIFIGAPGYRDTEKPQAGAVYSAKIANDLNKNIVFNDPWIIGDSSYARFGYSLVATDINHDGIDDLIVSAPSFGDGKPTRLEDSYPKKYNGKISLFFGKKDIGIQKMAEPDVEIRIPDEDSYYNLGLKLYVDDCNNDGYKELIIGSPLASSSSLGKQVGSVGIFYKINGEKKIIYINEADVYLKGFKQFQWFGHSASCSNNILFVGAPGARNDQNLQASGEVIGYDLTSKDKDIIFELKSEAIQSKFGYSVKYNSDLKLLAVGSPSANIDTHVFAGKVYIYDLNNGLPNNIANYSKTIQCSIDNSRFGDELLWHNNDLFVGSSLFGNWWDEITGHMETGKVYVYKNIQNFNTNLMKFDDASYCLIPKNDGRFGKAMAIKNNKLYINAPYAQNSANEWLSGKVYYYNEFA